jgi:galactokinase/mevalonate kinase-like predicted kinase
MDSAKVAGLSYPPMLGKNEMADARAVAQGQIPYRLDLAGGWLDQPFVSCHAAGPVVNVSVEPTVAFDERSGMASSSRRCAQRLWPSGIPAGDPVALAKKLFAQENASASGSSAGSQDALGIVLPGLKRLDYRGQAWPEQITESHDDKILDWLEQQLWLVPLGPRPLAFEVAARSAVTRVEAQRLAWAADVCWAAILQRDAAEFGRQMRAAFQAQTAMFPDMVNPQINTLIEQHTAAARGWKLSGAGGGGYLVLASETVIPHALRLKIRRANL